jgi:hypothetical protein
MVHEEPKTGRVALPIIAILLAMVGIVLLLMSNAGSHRQTRVFVRVQQPPAVSK